MGLEMDPNLRLAAIRLTPVQDLVGVVVQDRAARESVLSIAGGDATAEKVASRYVRRAGFTRDVVAEVFRRAAAATDKWELSLAIESVGWMAPQFVLEDPKPRQWSHAKEHSFSAARLMMVGSGRCSGRVIREKGDRAAHGRLAAFRGFDVCGATIASDKGRARYCDLHEPDLADFARQDRVAITALLTAVGECLGLRSGGVSELSPAIYEQVPVRFSGHNGATASAETAT